MNTTEANATAHLLRGEESQAERELLAEKAGKALLMRISPGHAPTDSPQPGSYCRQHGTRRDECGCEAQQ